MILDIMLTELGLPKVEYRQKIYDGSKVCVTVFFSTAMLLHDSESTHASISGVLSIDDDAAEDTVAIEAKGAWKTQPTHIRDYN